MGVPTVYTDGYEKLVKAVQNGKLPDVEQAMMSIAQNSVNDSLTYQMMTEIFLRCSTGDALRPRRS